MAIFLSFSALGELNALCKRTLDPFKTHNGSPLKQERVTSRQPYSKTTHNGKLFLSNLRLRNLHPHHNR